MKTHFIKLSATLCAFALISFVGCDSTTTDPVTPSDPDVAAPTNLMAASGDGSIFLKWTLSTSESQSNFGTYSITYLNRSTNESKSASVAKSQTTYRLDGLVNGTEYTITMRSVTQNGKQSSDLASINWAPAVRQSTDDQGVPIKVYATTSSLNSAIDLYNAMGKAEVIPQSGADFKTRGDFYFFAASSTSSTLSIISPAEANNQGEVTQFSTTTINADDLDSQYASEFPAASTFSLKQIDINDGTAATGKIFFARLVRGSDYYYFRILIKKGVSSGKIVQGSGNDRFITIVVSYQSTKNIAFAKH